MGDRSLFDVALTTICRRQKKFLLVYLIMASMPATQVIHY